MPKAVLTSTTSRRMLLAGSAALAAAPAAVMTRPDALLIAAVARAVALDRASDQLDDDTGRHDARVEELVGGWHAAMDAIITTPARTDAGRRAKAGLLHDLLDQTPDGRGPYGDSCASVRLAWSLVQDVLSSVT